MAAACAHHNPAECLTLLQALTMYTCDAARFGHAEGHTGRLAPGYDADLAVLDRDPSRRPVRRNARPRNLARRRARLSPASGGPRREAAAPI